METVVTSQPTETKRFINEREKFEAMKSKNPLLSDLTDQLNLELDNQ
jgi:hypothetical protein